MKLSDIKGERTLDVVADIIDPICDIAAGETARELFTRKKAPEGEDPRKFLANRLKAGIPALIKAHKKEIIRILTVISGDEGYAEKLTLPKLMKDVTGLLGDRAFLELFGAAQSMETSSGSAQENTAEA